MSKKLVGKVAVVTGASKGIGASTGMYEFSPLDGVTEEHFHRHFNVNVPGLLFTTKEAVKHMGSEGGSIINIGSVRVNSISPGMIETEGSRVGGFVGTDFQKTVQPDDIAPTAVYLASSDSKYMTGETLLVSGGLR
jgi:3-oxoacyl-[acyl-carrier protein] reductase